MVNVTKPNVALVMKMGQRPYVVNGSDAEIRLKKGLVICSFGKGKFKLREASEENSADGSILYHIQSPADEAFQGLGMFCLYIARATRDQINNMPAVLVCVYMPYVASKHV